MNRKLKYRLIQILISAVFQLINEKKQSMNKQKEIILKRIKNSVTSVEQDASVLLFGSQARNEEKAHSDWDIMILTSQPSDRKYEQQFRHKLIQVELEFGIAISAFVHSKKEWNTKYRVTPIYKSIEEEGIRI